MLDTQQILQGRYQLQKQLGNNAGRQTWLAADQATSPGELVIVKLLAFSPQMQWDEFKLFEREAQVLQQLNHPRIPRYRDYFSLDKQTGAGLCWFGLVQDYIPGADLQNLLVAGKRFTEEQVQSIATQVLKILEYLHQLERPVLHRDLKPSNLILDEKEQIYLVDFGAVADSAALEGVTFTVVGTTGYAPLEQFWGQAVPASDLYALGATLIHLLTGVSPAQLPQQDLRIQFREQVSLSPIFLSWIEALTQPDLELRFKTATEALKALETKEFIECPLQKVQPYFRTKIQLAKSPSQLKIIIPGRGFGLIPEIIAHLGKVLLSASLLIILIFLTLAAIMLGTNILTMLGSFIEVTGIFGIVIACFLMVGTIYFWKLVHREYKMVQEQAKKTQFSAFGDYLIQFSPKEFVIEYRKFNRCYFRQQGLNSEIKDIELGKNRKLIFQYGGTVCNLGNDIKIRNGKVYCLAKNLSKVEEDWLFKEIKSWLDTHR